MREIAGFYSRGGLKVPTRGDVRNQFVVAKGVLGLILGILLYSPQRTSAPPTVIFLLLRSYFEFTLGVNGVRHTNHISLIIHLVSVTNLSIFPNYALLFFYLHSNIHVQ